MEIKELVKELKKAVSEGYVFDEENSTPERAVFIKKDNKPRSWEEYCKTKRTNCSQGYEINNCSRINKVTWDEMMHPNLWKNVLPSEEYAKAFLAFMQLISLKKEWVEDWEVDFLRDTKKYYFRREEDTFRLSCSSFLPNPLAFPTQEMAIDFYETFKDLYEQAKILL